MKVREPVDAKKYLFPIILSLLFMTIYLCADSVAYKLVKIGPAIEPGPPFIFPLSYAIADIIAEVYGSSLTKIFIWGALICQILFAFIVKWIIALPSPQFWQLQSAYNDVFGHIVRFVFSGTFSVLASSFISVFLLVKIKIITNGRHFWLRNIISSAVGGIVLILIIILFGYLPVVGIKSSMIMFVSIYLLELFYAFILVIPCWVLVNLLKKHEQVDVFDYNAKFNPFKF